MRNIDLAISEYGQSIGMSGLELDSNDLLCMESDTFGALRFEQISDSLLIFLVCSFDRFRGGLLEQALDLCHPRHKHPLQPRVGLTTDEKLVFSLCLADRDVQLSSLTQAVDFLMKLFERLEK